MPLALTHHRCVMLELLAAVILSGTAATLPPGRTAATVDTGAQLVPQFAAPPLHASPLLPPFAVTPVADDDAPTDDGGPAAGASASSSEPSDQGVVRPFPAPRLTPASWAQEEGGGGRLRFFLDETVRSPSFGMRVALAATWSHTLGAPREWTRGGDGYARRLGASASKLASETGIRHATAAALRLDPRGSVERCGCNGAWARTRFALGRAFVTRDAQGRLMPDVPLLAGLYGGALAARTWDPRRDRSTADALRAATISLAAHAGFMVVREFRDELRRLLPFPGKPARPNHD
ncbi:MAG TPA: hypothetical protein VIL35_10645 [Vicinamibacterales bacterium]